MRVATKVEYKEFCRKIDHLAEEIKELQGAVAIEAIWGEGSEGAWENLIKLEGEVSARWQGPDVVEELRSVEKD